MRKQAFAVLVNQYSEQMYWKVRHIVIRHEDADDVMQNAWIKAWTRLDKFRGDSQISTWLYRICINEAIDFTRRRKEMLNSQDNVQVADTLYADKYFNGDEVEKQLIEAIDTLPEAQRTTFMLRYYEEMPYREISEITGTTEAGLKTNYHLAVKKIKSFFEKQD